MQCFNHWPEKAKFALPESVAEDLYHHLLEPFDDEPSAQSFWKDTPSSIIILNEFDSIERLQKNAIWKQIEFTLTYPEYTEPLKRDYQVMVAIVNDSGSGIYLVIPPGLSLLNSEGKRFEQ